MESGPTGHIVFEEPQSVKRDFYNQLKGTSEAWQRIADQKGFRIEGNCNPYGYGLKLTTPSFTITGEKLLEHVQIGGIPQDGQYGCLVMLKFNHLIKPFHSVPHKGGFNWRKLLGWKHNEALHILCKGDALALELMTPFIQRAPNLRVSSSGSTLVLLHFEIASEREMIQFLSDANKIAADQNMFQNNGVGLQKKATGYQK